MIVADRFEVIEFAICVENQEEEATRIETLDFIFLDRFRKPEYTKQLSSSLRYRWHWNKWKSLTSCFERMLQIIKGEFVLIFLKFSYNILSISYHNFVVT